MIPEDKYYSNECFNWNGANVQHCLDVSGKSDEVTTFFVSEGLYFVRPTEEGKREGVYMLSEDEFKQYFTKVESPSDTAARTAEAFERGFPMASQPRPIL